MDSLKHGPYLKSGGPARTIDGRTRPPSVAANALDGSASTPRESTTSHDQIGLATERTMLPQSLSTRPEIDGGIPTPFVEFAAGRYVWRVARSHAQVLKSAEIDWFNLAGHPDAALVKRNSQRDVWRLASCGGRYFAKIYHPVGALARLKLLLRGPIAAQEWEVGLYGAAHSVSTVVPVAMAWEDGRRITGRSLLITEEVSDSLPLNDFWLTVRQNRVEADMLADALARLIARAHQCGFQHGDMHPGNILVRRSASRCEVFFVDLHRVKTGRCVMPRHAVANLAQLNQWFRRNAGRSQRLRFLQAYIRYRDQFAQASSLARNWRIDIGKLVADLAVQAERHANRLWAKRDRRAMRDNRYFAKLSPARGWRGHALLETKHPAGGAKTNLCFSKSDWRQWLRDPPSWVDPARQKLLKDSHTATIFRARLEADGRGIDVVVKRTLARNGWKKFVQMFGPSRNIRSWRLANMLRNRDLPVATPLAVIERFAAGVVRTDSISFTEFISDAVDLETFLTREVAALPGTMQRSVKNRLIESVVQLLRAFHERGFVHRDMKAPNLMVRWPAPHVGTPVLTFIDMDGISHRRRSSEAQRTRAVVRLCASLLGSPGCTASDRLRFLKTYLTAPGRPPTEWKAYWRRIHTEVCSKLHDKELRRSWKLAHYGRE
ncbi:MAG: hypothetical protein DCC65_11465 [Planctomycetota bacterium]|nr:MAG: hypothetical protein DCC65_11465 [Planctomycetota bacterium]